MNTQKKTTEDVNLEKKSNKNFGKLIIKIVLLIVLISLSIILIKSSLTANTIFSYDEKRKYWL